MINQQAIHPSLKAMPSLVMFKLQSSIAKLQQISRRLNVQSALALAGIAGPLMLAVSDLVAATHTPGYSLVKNSISSLALTQLGWLQTIGFLTLGLLVEVFTAGLLYNIKNARFFHLGIGIFVFFGFAMLLIGAFHTDAVGGPKTFEGSIHGFSAKVTFSFFAIALLSLANGIKKDPGWRHLFRYTLVTAALAVPLGVALYFFKEGANWFGLVERALVANMIIWVEVAAVNLLILSLKRPRRVENQAGIG
jgi:hypothetical membrane protein